MADQLSPEQAQTFREVIDKAQNAAREGSAEASYFLALLAAAGVELPHDLTACLEHLQRAAERGQRAAQRELAALAAEWPLADEIAGGKPQEAETWARLRAAVDVASWLGAPGAEVLSQAPRISLLRGFASAPLCDWLIQAARPHLQQARIFDYRSGGMREDDRRSNSTAELNLSRMDTVVGFLRARIAALARVPVAWLNAESCQVMHYRVGQQFTPHHDFLDVSHPSFAQDVAANGQRALTVLVYLNEEYADGETAFPVLGRRFRGRKGDALAFWNVTPQGAPDPSTLHAGTPPTSGEKWLLSQWVRVRAT